MRSSKPFSFAFSLACVMVLKLLLQMAREHGKTIVIVTHNMQQASRISDVTAFFYRGRIVEVGPTKQIFQNPKNKQTEDYVSGRFG